MMTLSPMLIGIIIFAVILAGAFAGMMARRALPEQHLNDQTKSLVTSSMAVVGTISALVLGLLLTRGSKT
jgi:hypothetical protein